VKKVNQRRVHEGDITSPSTKKRKLNSSKAVMISDFCHNSQEDEVEAIDKVLDGKEFCVLSTCDELPSMHELKILLRTHGAQLTEFPRKNTFAIIAGKLEEKIKVYMKAKSHNIIKADWLANNFDKDIKLTEMPKLEPKNFHFILDNMKKEFLANFDEYYDAYDKEVESIDDLKLIINGMSVDKKITTVDLMEFENELYDEDFANPNIFRGMSGRFYNPAKDNFLLRSAETIFKYRGGIISSDKKALIFIDKCDTASAANKFEQAALYDFHFILDSNNAAKILSVDKFKIN
jgi:hypothetical protein